jgi:hypothetical protein
VNYLRDPLRQLERYQRELASGKAVTLVGETGLPAWYRWRTNAAKGKVTLVGDTLVVQADELGLVELLPDPMVSSYWLCAQVRHDIAHNVQGMVGIYFAYGTGEAPGMDEVHLFCALEFNDLITRADIAPGQPVRNPIILSTKRLFFPPRYPLVGCQDQSVWDYFEPALPKKDGWLRPDMPAHDPAPWRDIRVKVTLEGLQAYWAQKLLPDLPRAKFDEILEGFAEELPGNLWRALPRGGLGLYVKNGSASFRNVIVEPIVGDNY